MFGSVFYNPKDILGTLNFWNKGYQTLEEIELKKKQASG